MATQSARLINSLQSGTGRPVRPAVPQYSHYYIGHLGRPQSHPLDISINAQNGRPSVFQYSAAASKTALASSNSWLWLAPKCSLFSKMRTYPVFVDNQSRSVRQSFSASQLLPNQAGKLSA